MQILHEVLGALGTADEFGVVHRDIKPENILSGAGHAVIAHFGVSKALAMRDIPLTSARVHYDQKLEAA